MSADDSPLIPPAAIFWRRPLIRHVRYAVHVRRVHRHVTLWASVGFLPMRSEHDRRVLDQIWRGIV